MKAIDLTHTLSLDIPDWDGACGFKLSLSLDYNECTEPDLFRKHDMSTPTGVGTHIDAPSHCLPGGKTIEQLTLDELVTDCVVIDVSAEANENYVIMPSIVEAFEKEHDEITPNSFVVFYTGWEKFWSAPEHYNNDHTFPSVHVSTAELLLKRNIAGLGIDTLSCDTGKEGLPASGGAKGLSASGSAEGDRGDQGFPVHRAILGAGKYLVENIANAKLLPAVGAKSLVLPMKIEGGTEAPIRLIALI